MSVYIGGYDPLKLIEGVINLLIEKGVISVEEGNRIIREAQAPSARQEPETREPAEAIRP